MFLIRERALVSTYLSLAGEDGSKRSRAPKGHLSELR
jgi:hypothetical protein